MKKYFLFIAGVIILLFNTQVHAQFVAPSQAEINEFTHNMVADSADRWSYSGLFYGDSSTRKLIVPKLAVWVRAHAADNQRRILSMRLNGDVLSAQFYNADELELATTSITPANADKYQYRVMSSDGAELVPWTKPSAFRSNKFTSYAYLGRFNSRNKAITLTIAEKAGKANPLVITYNCDNIPAVKIDQVFVQYHTGLAAQYPREWEKGFAIMPAKGVESINLRIQNTSKNELYHVYLKTVLDGKDTMLRIGNNWEHGFGSPDPEMRINSSWFNSKPGKYTIVIRPELEASYGHVRVVGSEATARFTVLPGPVALPLKTVALIVLIILTTGGFMFMMYRDGQKRKLAAEAKNKQIATLQLASVRAQLNPHFIFNALAGIQNLMNKNDVEGANKYLARFARLTRNVLDDGNKELVSIEQEISLLNDYLLMEQTRFGFKFSIEADESQIDRQIEIPAMLLQPFVENAVKHGVSALNGNGMIEVIITQKEHTLILAVIDNGKGFGATASAGMGIKLCEDRIRLLNSIYKNSTILLHKTSGDKGTQITVELQNWV